MGVPTYSMNCFHFPHRGPQRLAFVIKTKIFVSQYSAYQSLSMALTSFLPKATMSCEAGCGVFCRQSALYVLEAQYSVLQAVFPH